jgi:hypothetical protein
MWRIYLRDEEELAVRLPIRSMVHPEVVRALAAEDAARKTRREMEQARDSNRVIWSFSTIVEERNELAEENEVLRRVLRGNSVRVLRWLQNLRLVSTLIAPCLISVLILFRTI